MSDSNPYEAPQNIEEVLPKNVTPHTTSVRAEAWRGAKFGAKWTGIAFLILGAVGFILEGSILIASSRQTSDAGWQIAKLVLLFPIEIGIIACGGGVIGAFVMGSVAAIRKLFNRSSKQSKDVQ
jgi:hypothetical protein